MRFKRFELDEHRFRKRDKYHHFDCFDHLDRDDFRGVDDGDFFSGCFDVWLKLLQFHRHQRQFLFGSAFLTVAKHADQ